MAMGVFGIWWREESVHPSALVHQVTQFHCIKLKKSWVYYRTWTAICFIRPCLRPLLWAVWITWWPVMPSQYCTQCRWLQRNSICLRGTLTFPSDRSMGKREGFRPTFNSRPISSPSSAPGMKLTGSPSMCAFQLALMSSSLSQCSSWMVRIRCWSSKRS